MFWWLRSFGPCCAARSPATISAACRQISSALAVGGAGSPAVGICAAAILAFWSRQRAHRPFCTVIGSPHHLQQYVLAIYRNPFGTTPGRIHTTGFPASLKR